MVCTYKRKSLPPSYSKEDLNTALENVRSCRMTLCRAAELCKIPKAALFKHVNGIRGVKGKRWVDQLLSPSTRRKKKFLSVLS